MSVYPHFEDICDASVENIIPEGKDAVLFRRRRKDKIGVVSNLHMNENGIQTTNLDWKAIKKVEDYKSPGFVKIDYDFKLGSYFQVVRQAAFLNENGNLPPYREDFYFPDHLDEDEFGLFHKADASNWSLAGSNEFFSTLKPPMQGLSPEDLTHLCDENVSQATTTGRFRSFRRWFLRIRNRMRH